jgi:hypothetical protein
MVLWVVGLYLWIWVLAFKFSKFFCEVTFTFQTIRCQNTEDNNMNRGMSSLRPNFTHFSLNSLTILRHSLIYVISSRFKAVWLAAFCYAIPYFRWQYHS